MFLGSTGFRNPRFGLGSGPPDMTLQFNTAGQNVTFCLINPASDAALTGAAGAISVFVSKSGSAQAAGAGLVTELGHGAYNYAPTQNETNATCVSFLMTAPNAVPENLMFLTGNLHKNVVNQHVTFGLYTTAGLTDTAATPATISVFVSKDGGAQAVGGGTITNLGNGQYDYAPTQNETNGVTVSFLFTAPGDVPQNLSIFTVTP